MDNHATQEQSSAQGSGRAAPSVAEPQEGGVRRQTLIPAHPPIREYNLFDALNAEDQAEEITLQDMRKYLHMYHLPSM